MQLDIRLAGGKTLYYPYLDNKVGSQTSFRDEIAWIALYSLFVDRILIPPSSAFQGRYALQNLALLKANVTLRSLSERGVLVTSSAKESIRDFGDLFEAYSGLVGATGSRRPELAVFGRDEIYQRQIYATQLPTHLLRQNAINEKLIQKVLDSLGAKPQHAQFLTAIQDISDSEIERQVIRSAATIAYFHAGALGNAALTPPVTGDMPHEYFDYFYSKDSVVYFRKELERVLQKPILALTPAELLRLRDSLGIFREQYYLLAEKHRSLFLMMIHASQQFAPVIRLKAPIIGLQAVVATAVSVALAPIFGLAATGIAIAAKFGWEAFAKSTRLNDKTADYLRARVVLLGLIKPHERELLDSIETFRKALRAIAA